MATEDHTLGSDPSGSGSKARTSTVRRRLVFGFVIAVALAIAASIGFAARDGSRIAREVRAGRATFRSILSGGISAHGDLRTATAAATRSIDAADAHARRSVWIGFWSHVPVLGEPARWVRGATGAISRLAHVADSVVGQVEPQLDTARDPANRLRLLNTIAAEFGRLRAAVDAVDIPGTGWFVPQVDSADAELRRDLARLRRAVDDGAIASRGLHAFLQGPTKYVVLAANNAEMRAGGMVLQAGLLRAANGRLEAGPFRSTGDIKLKKAVDVPPEIQRLYGWLDPGREWRNTNSSPDFPEVAPVFVRMANSILRSPADGALQIDVPALAALLKIIGPVEVEGRSYNAANVSRLVMHDLYQQFGADQHQRQRQFSALATQTFKALTDRRWDARVLIQTLSRAAHGRHLMFWSSDPSEQAMWRRLGVDGSLRQDGLMITIQNHGGNKLDWFLRPSMSITTQKKTDGFTRVTLDIHIANPSPVGEAQYIEGDGSIVPVGGYRAFVAAYLPGWATNVDLTGAPTIVFGPDGPMRVVGTRVDIPHGGVKDIRIAFDAPPHASIELLPSGRVPGMPVRLRGRTYTDGVRRLLEI